MMMMMMMTGPVSFLQPFHPFEALELVSRACQGFFFFSFCLLPSQRRESDAAEEGRRKGGKRKAADQTGKSTAREQDAGSRDGSKTPLL
jgi:hypothetical protein